MEKLSKAGFRLVGLRLEQKTSNKNNQSNLDCGNLWQKFEKENIIDLIPNRLGNEIYAVYFDYEKDEAAPFSYFIGCRVDDNVETPKNLNSLKIPSQKYQKVTARGVMTGCIIDAWNKIWNADIERKFGFDFEVYDERSENWDDAVVDIYVSIA
ncbi:MAG: effector binding domain-containing protein [Muricauda sp.]|nr:GyrI-like domain-containing protein [Allomuricauda sp.]MBA4745673.1 effector binding domain-containing protein [Allomuricauda sp.]